MAKILIIDDEIGIRELLSEILTDEGHTVVTAENAAAARAARQDETLDLVLLDIWMPDTDGVTLLKEWASHGQLTMPVIMMSGHATIDTAVEATRFGALEFLEKPIAMARLLTAVRAGLERGRIMRNVRGTMAPPLVEPGVAVAWALPLGETVTVTVTEVPLLVVTLTVVVTEPSLPTETLGPGVGPLGGVGGFGGEALFGV